MLKTNALPLAFALALIVIVFAPVLAIAGLALEGNIAGNIFSIYQDSKIMRYTFNTLSLMLAGGVMVALLGMVCAWLVVCFDFHGRRFLSIACILPFTLPPFISGIAYVDMLEYAGPVQTFMRDNLALTDFRLPSVRSFSGAVFLYSFSLFPYAYVLSRAALVLRLGNQSAVARVFSPTTASSIGVELRSLVKVVLPVALPGLIAGVSIAMMEIVADYGVASIFGQHTLAKGIFDSWLLQGELVTAARLVVLAVILAAVLLAMERHARNKLTPEQAIESPQKPIRRRLDKLAGFGATATLSIISSLGFFIPVAYLATFRSFASFSLSELSEIAHSAWQTFVFAGLVALIALGVAVFVSASMKSKVARNINALSACGYAIPGLVFAFGILLILVPFDLWLIDSLGWWTTPIFIGTLVPLGIAMVARFYKISQGGAEQVLNSIPQGLKQAAQLFGHNSLAARLRTFVPLLASPLSLAFVLTFVEMVKELPMALVLRPAGFEPLAVKVFTYATDERLSQAIPAALAMIVVGALPLALGHWRSSRDD